MATTDTQQTGQFSLFENEDSTAQPASVDSTSPVGDAARAAPLPSLKPGAKQFSNFIVYVDESGDHGIPQTALQ